MTSAMPQPGWYNDGRGMRWWDGNNWGPYAPAGSPGGVSSNDHTLAILSHFGIVAGGFILPLIFYLITNDQTHPEARHHSREALNFQLTFLVAYLTAWRYPVSFRFFKK